MTAGKTAPIKRRFPAVPVKNMTNRTNFSFRLVWGLLMVIIYLGMCYMLIFTSLFDTFSPTLRYIFGGIFLLYGVFRAFKIWQNRR
ncbi:MAG TPA: hypothetical protein DD409_02225 [Bacteroidales bacterium]|jgi:uncharacterized membrane protein HdeD (DUF308 family)|nr:hypothetical protein [Bacteroidales bacterium]